MQGFFHLKSADLNDQKAVGEAIMKVMRTVGQDPSEWKEFKRDPKAWLHKVGYRYKGPGAGPDGRAPDTLTITVVEDTATEMFVRIPWKGELDTIPVILDEPSYGQGPQRFPVLLARYFIRRCR